MTDWSPRRDLRTGALVLVFGLGGFVLWAVTARIDAAVVAAGQVEVEARRQLIQHPDGGLVAAIRVRDGDAVAAGAELLVLDGTELAAERALLDRALLDAQASIDRLRAELHGSATPDFRQTLRAQAAAVPAVQVVLADEADLHETRASLRLQTLRHLGERVRQVEAGIAGRAAQLAALRRQAELLREDLAAQEALLAGGLTHAGRVSALRRDAAQAEADIAGLQAGLAEARSALAGIEIESLHLQASWRGETLAELRALRTREAELLSRRQLVDARIDRLILRAPMAGTVFGLRATTIGGVIPPGAEVAAIVPGNVPLVIRAEIDPGQIDRIRPGQPAILRFPGLGAGMAPDVPAALRTVSADAMVDPATGRRYYLAELTLDPGAVGTSILPGMPVEVFFRTGARSPAAFLVQPLADAIARTMREE